MIGDSQRLLLPDELPCVECINSDGGSPFLLIGDHSGNIVPSALEGLGVVATEFERHIGWDIGVEALGRSLSARLDAVFVRQRYSRLVIDCNRDPISAEAIPEVSDGTVVPGNIGLSAASRALRVGELHTPYQAAIGAELARNRRTLVSLHSFTQSLAGDSRPWEIGVLHDGANDVFAKALLGWLIAADRFVIGDNQPYRMDATDYTVPHHAFAAQLPYVELEIRQDLLLDERGVEAIAAHLAAGFIAIGL